jgi:hypothetical protein
MGSAISQLAGDSGKTSFINFYFFKKKPATQAYLSH